MTEEHVPVRLSHLLRDCSVGAIVRGPESLMVVQDTRTWDRPGSEPLDREIRYVDRVRSALGIDRALRAPPRSAERNGTVTGWIPALRFPTWMRCLNCGLLHPAPWRRPRARGSGGRSTEAGGAEGAGECVCCSGRLEQVPWVLVHEEGYLADVPWHELAHGDTRDPERRQCGRDWTESYLQLRDTGTERQIRCTRCGANERLRSGALPRMPFPPRTWQQPWVREPPAQSPKASGLADGDQRRAGALPPRPAPRSSSRRNRESVGETVLDRLYGSSKNQQWVRDAKYPLARKNVVRRLASDYRCTPAEIEEAIAEIDKGYPLYGRAITADDLLADEYRALVKEIPDLGEDEDFVTEHHSREWTALRGTLDEGVARRAAYTVSRLVAVNKLKEIMVLTGFQRAGGRPTPPDLNGESPWLPALELHGEGIFFTLDEDLLQRWESDAALRERADAFAERYVQRAGQGIPEFEVEVTPRFLLCHTLAHLLIRELEAERGVPCRLAGRNASTVRPAGSPWPGFSSTWRWRTREGSLGGLMELAKPERFLRLLTGALEAASWCSLDPVCSEQEGHGPDLLNRAACHACALVPEPSCPYGNVLLDRVFVKGSAPEIAAFADHAEAPG